MSVWRFLALTCPLHTPQYFEFITIFFIAMNSLYYFIPCTLSLCDVCASCFASSILTLSMLPAPDTTERGPSAGAAVRPGGGAAHDPRGHRQEVQGHQVILCAV